MADEELWALAKAGDIDAIDRLAQRAAKDERLLGRMLRQLQALGPNAFVSLARHAPRGIGALVIHLHKLPAAEQAALVSQLEAHQITLPSFEAIEAVIPLATQASYGQLRFCPFCKGPIRVDRLDTVVWVMCPCEIVNGVFKGL